MTLHEVQFYLDREGASDLVAELVMKSCLSPSVFMEAAQLRIALLVIQRGLTINCSRPESDPTAARHRRLKNCPMERRKKGVSPAMSSPPGSSFLPTRPEDAGPNVAMEIPYRTNPPPPTTSTTVFQ